MAEKVIKLSEVTLSTFKELSSFLVRNDESKDFELYSYSEVASAISSGLNIPDTFVKSVCEVLPDATGNIEISHTDVGAYSIGETDFKFLMLDGSNITGNIDFKGFLIKGVGNPLEESDAINLKTFNDKIKEFNFVKTLNDLTPDDNGNIFLTPSDMGAVDIEDFIGHVHKMSDITDLDLGNFLVKDANLGVSLDNGSGSLQLYPDYINIGSVSAGAKDLSILLTSSGIRVNSKDNTIKSNILPSTGVYNVSNTDTLGDTYTYQLDLIGRSITKSKNGSIDGSFDFMNSPDYTLVTKRDLIDYSMSNGSAECGVVKFVYAEETDGMPINLPKHLLWCNGRSVNRAENSGLVGIFIDWAYNKPTLRTQFQIDASKLSMKLPDLRDKHLVGSGSLNPVYSYATSKSVDYITGATTTIANRILTASTIVNNKTGLWTNGGGAHTININRGDGVSVIDNDFYQGSNTFKRTKALQYVPEHNHFIPDHNHTATTTIEDHNHTATTTINTNGTLIDSVNRVPAFALFPVLDINTNTIGGSGGGGSLTADEVLVVGDNNIGKQFTISDIETGLFPRSTNTLVRDSISIEHRLDTNGHFKRSMLRNSGLELLHFNINGTDITTLVDNRITRQTSDSYLGWVDLKFGTCMFVKDGSPHNYSSAPENFIQTKENTPRIYRRKYTANAGSISGSSTSMLFNLVTEDPNPPFDNALTWYWDFNNPNSKCVKEHIYNPRVLKSHKIRVRYIRTSGNTMLECSLRRGSDDSYVTGAGASVNDTDFSTASFEFSTYTHFDTDPFVTQGYYIQVKNLTNQSFNYSSLQIDVETMEYPVQHV